MTAPDEHDDHVPAGGHRKMQLGHPSKPSSPAAAKDPHHKQTIIAAASVGAVLLGYLTYRKSKSSSTAAPARAGVVSTGSSGTVAGSDTTSTSDNQLGAILANLQGQITDLAGGVGNTAQSTAAIPADAIPPVVYGAGATAANGEVFTRNTDTGEIDEYTPGYSVPRWLKPSEWAAIIQGNGGNAPSVGNYSGAGAGVNDQGYTYTQTQTAAAAAAVAAAVSPGTIPTTPPADTGQSGGNAIIIN